MVRSDRHPGSPATLTLTDPESESTAVLAPSRGGMLTSLVIAGRELLYLDRATFDDPHANVRGGVPVLFPSPGKLAGDTWARGGARGAMKQHGFARNLPWEEAGTGDSEAEGAWARLALRSSEETRAQYPFDFRAEYTYRLRRGQLTIEMCIENQGGETMPFGAGFHPYFAVRDADKASARIPTRATRAFDNTVKCEVPFSGFDFTAPEVDLHLLDHGSTEASLTVGDLTVTLAGSPEFTHWVVWALRGRDFLCVEPWTCPGDALNTGERLLLLEPGASRRMSLSIGRG